jgi:hypothetical protein
MHPTEGKGLFDNNTKICQMSGKRLPQSYEGAFCPNCVEIQLLHEVKDYIRENDVNEYQVADHFNIPLRQVKTWIRQGRIEYRPSNAAETIASIHCQRCGAPVNFGSLCPKCLALINRGSIKGFEGTQLHSSSNDRMHYLDQN